MEGWCKSAIAGVPRRWGKVSRSRGIKRSAAWLFALAFVLFLIASNVRLIVNETRFYDYGFDKYEITEETGLPKVELMKVADHLIRYFNDREDSPQVRVTRADQSFDLFNDREIAHLKDVRTLIRLFYVLQWVTAGYLAVYLIVLGIRRRGRALKDVAGTLFRGSLITLGIVALLGLWALVDFDSLFLLFHHLGFRNDLWQLDPSRDYLIMLFPEGFFLDGALFLVGGLAMELLLVAGIAWLYLRRAHRGPGSFPSESPGSIINPTHGVRHP